MSSNNNNNNNNNNNMKSASKKAQTAEEMDDMLNNLNEALELATTLGYKECAVCKTMSQKDLPCETCGKPRTEYAADVVLSIDEMLKGFDRMCDWADKKKREGQN